MLNTPALIRDFDSNMFVIADWKMEELNKKITSLNKRASKLGCPLVEVIDHFTTEIEDPRFFTPDTPPISQRDPFPMIKVHQIEIKSDPIKLAGWSFVGSMDHITLPGKTIMKSIPGKEIPSQYFGVEPICEHCNTIRRRNDTFIVQHESGEYKQVGRSCLKDFLGQDPKTVISYLTRLFKDLKSLDDEEYWGVGGGPQFWHFGHIQVLKLTIACSRTFGWVARSKVEEMGQQATADLVFTLLVPPFDRHDREQIEDVRSQLIFNENDEQTAKDAIEWLKEQDSSNEYMYNLKTIMESESIPHTMLGYWCSLASAYHRYLTANNEKKSSGRKSEWVGEVKQRLDMTVHVNSIIVKSGDFGPVEIHRMIDDNGRSLTWFANTHSKLEEGNTYKIKATIKEHDTYNNWKQTRVNRVTIIEKI